MRIPFFLFFLFISVVVVAQDSIPAGVIKVQRKPIDPAYHVQMFVMYGDSNSRARITDFSLDQIVISDSGFDARAPQPLYTIESRLLDSPHAFNWGESLKEIHYQFAWADTSRSDSARFTYYIDKKGNAVCRPLPWMNADSTCRAFEKKAQPYMTSLRRWIPARKIKRRLRHKEGGKLKPVSSFVTIIIYAYDPDKGKLLPIEIAPK